jgi:hypothetical protein
MKSLGKDEEDVLSQIREERSIWEAFVINKITQFFENYIYKNRNLILL